MLSTIVIMLDEPSPGHSPATGASAAETAVENGAGDSGEFVQSLERGLSVIRAFDAEHARLTLSEVAAATGLSRAAARRFLHTLVHLGYMRTAGGRFELRPKILELGYAYLSSLTLPEVAMPHLEELVAEVHESSSVSELDGGDVVYIARVPTRRIMTVTISVGTRFPAYATSMGRVLLAAQPEAWLDAYLSTASLHHLTGHTITTESGLRQELRKIRARGWALIDQELEEGLRSLAAPIRDSDGTVVAAVNVATHAGRRSLDSIVADLLSPLLATAERIERDLSSARSTGAATTTRRAGGPPDTRAGHLTHLCSMRTLLADHPLVTHKLTLLRAATTDNATFRMLATELVTLLAYEATRDVRVTPVEVTTPVATATGAMLDEPKPLIVPVLRAGIGMLDGMTRLMPMASVGFVGMVRDEESLVASTYANRLPVDLAGREVFVLDPMLATGGTLVTVISMLLDRGATAVTAICLLAAPEGLAKIDDAFPGENVRVVTGAIDDHLNDKGYIVPGLGDAGDRLFGEI
jgi:uracil phosphoribosyltransferase